MALSFTDSSVVYTDSKGNTVSINVKNGVITMIGFGGNATTTSDYHNKTAGQTITLPLGDNSITYTVGSNNPDGTLSIHLSYSPFSGAGLPSSTVRAPFPIFGQWRSI